MALLVNQCRSCITRTRVTAAVRTIYHVFRPNTTPLCPIVYYPFPLTDESVQQDVPIIVGDADAGERGLASFRPYADHLAIHGDVFPGSAMASEGSSMGRSQQAYSLLMGGRVLELSRDHLTEDSLGIILGIDVFFSVVCVSAGDCGAH